MRGDPGPRRDPVESMGLTDVLLLQQGVLKSSVAVAHIKDRRGPVPPQAFKDPALQLGQPPRIDRRPQDHQILRAKDMVPRPLLPRRQIDLLRLAGEQPGQRRNISSRPPC